MNFHDQWIALSTLATKEIRRFLRIWSQTILPSAITMTLYFVIFGNVIGRRIGEIGGVSYIQYVAPGLIMMAVLTNSYSNVVSSFFGNKFQRCIEELLVSPTPNYIILAGFVSGGVVRGLLVGVAVTLVSLFFTHIEVHNLAIIFVTAVLTAVLFSIAGLVNGVFARNFDDVNIVPTFVLTPLTYLGGVFYPISLLPEFGQLVSKLNPILYMVNAFRYGFLGISDVSIAFALGLILVLIFALGGLALYLLETGSRLRS